MSADVERRQVLPVARKVESMYYVLGGGWIAWLLTDGEWLSAVLLSVPMLTVIFVPRRVDDVPGAPASGGSGLR